jgi:Transposase and inactivated derivatives
MHLFVGFNIVTTLSRKRMLAEQLDYNLLFYWFVGLFMDAMIWDHSSYSKNRKRILHSDLAVMFLRSICCQAEAAGLLPYDHFTVDGTLIETWASLKSFRPKDEELPASTGDNRNPEVDFHGEKRCMIRTLQSPILHLGCSRKEKARRPISASWTMY